MSYTIFPQSNMLLLLFLEWGVFLMITGQNQRLMGRASIDLPRPNYKRIWLLSVVTDSVNNSGSCLSWFTYILHISHIFHIYSCSQIGKVYYNMEKWQKGWPDWAVVTCVKFTWILFTVMLLRDEDQGQYYSVPSVTVFITFRKRCCWEQTLWEEDSHKVPGQVSQMAWKKLYEVQQRQIYE